MKILFVVEHFHPYVGGAEELFLNLTTSLVERGHDICVVTTLHDTALPAEEYYKGVRIVRVKCYNRYLFTLMSLPSILRNGKTADLIHTTSYTSALPAFAGGLLLRKKVLITFHEIWGRLWFRLPFTPSWKLTAFYLFEKFIVKLPFHKYIAVSDFTGNALKENGVPENKIVKIYNGLNYQLFAQHKHHLPEKFTFCYFGRLGLSKGIDLLLEAAKKFLSLHPDSRFKLIIPTYPKKLFNRIKELIKHYELDNNLILLHNLPKEQLLREVSESSCVVIPSHSEGFCFVAVEAVAMGVPIISSGKGSLPEVVGGNTIQLDELTSDSIYRSLVKAKRNEWNFVPPTTFNLQNSMDAYATLYNDML